MYDNDGENYNDQIMMMTHSPIHIKVMVAGLMPMDVWQPMGGRPAHDDLNYHNEDSQHNDHKGHDDHNYHDNQNDHND